MARSRPAATQPFQALYRRHYGFVWQAVRRFGVVPALTDDAVQDTFITAYRRFDEMAMPSAKAWLYGIARRVASNYRRADHRASRKRSALALTTVPASVPRPEAVIVLERFLESLTPIDRELFVLSEIEGMSGPEAASALALNVSTTYSRVQSLRRRFRESLVESDPREVVRAAKDDRPRATAQGWARLLPELGLASATKAAPLALWGTIAKVAALALPVAVAVGLGVTRSEAAPRPASAPAVIESSARSAAEPAVVATPASAVAAAAPVPAALVEPLPVPTAKPRAREPERADAPSLSRHNQLIRDASEQLRNGDAAAALATTDVHAREFPDSAIADARTALRIEALCALGNTSQARGEARVFAREHASSVVVARIERSCVGTLVESSPSGQANGR